MENRHHLLNQLASLRTDPDFDQARVRQLFDAMGRLEVEAASIEARAYRKIRASMSEEQLATLMKMRGNYVLDENQIADLDMAERGAALAILCSGCHGAPGRPRIGLPGPSLDGFWHRPIASGPDFEYSDALRELGRKSGDKKRTPELLDQFLVAPKRFVPGTKMEFQDLLREKDRKALIDHLKASR